MTKTDQQKIEHLAKIEGLGRVEATHPRYNTRTIHFFLGKGTDWECRKVFAELPNYLTSLDALRLVLLKFTPRQESKLEVYFKEQYKDKLYPNISYLRRLLSIEPSDLAEAVLQATGFYEGKQ